MAFPAVAALMAAGSAATAGVVLAAVAEVGLAMTVVGAVTGSKTLMKIGGVMSLVGGIGGLVNGAVGAGATAGAETIASASGLADAAGAAYEAGGAGIMDGFGAAGMEAGAADLAGASAMTDLQAMPVGPSAPSPGPAAMGDAAQTAAAQPGGIVNPGPTVNDVAGARAPADLEGAVAPAGPSTPAAPTGANAPTTSGNFFSFIEKNKTLFNSGVQLVGGALKGAAEGDMWDQKMELERNRQKYGNSVGRSQPRGIVTGARPA